jgi:hypothetical protein
VLAQRRGLRIHEVPVDWVDDPDSRVQIVRTAVDDLRGVARLAASAPLPRFLGIGVVCTGRSAPQARTPPRGLELAVLVLGSVLATVTRYVALKTWVFARRHSARTAPAIEGELS